MNKISINEKQTTQTGTSENKSRNEMFNLLKTRLNNRRGLGHPRGNRRECDECIRYKYRELKRWWNLLSGSSITQKQRKQQFKN